MLTPNNIDGQLNREARTSTGKPKAPGPIAAMLAAYQVQTSNRLLGFLLNIGYDNLTLLTCDAWKLKCGGVPRNSFVIIKLNGEAAEVPGNVAGRLAAPFLILARISESATTPVAADIQSTIFQIHKIQARIDPLTNAELQMGRT
jgi:hypothetical protein